MIELNDQLGRTVKLAQEASRIICLVPSITELLADLGLTKRIVGRTKFCIFPKSLKETIPQIGGTKQVHFDKIAALSPDLIITNKEENTEEIVETLSKDYSVYISNIQTIHSALAMISDIGVLTGTSSVADKLVDNIEKKRIAWHQKELPSRTCLYLIWKNPYMTIGIDTFIYNMLKEVNFESSLYDFRYPELTREHIKELKPEYLLLSSEPFPFREKDLNEIKEEFPDCKVVLVDGTFFSWYGSRILPAYNYFDKLQQSL